MSGHRPFVELTKHFDDEHRKRVAERYAELRSVLLLYESPEDKERKYKVSVSLIRTYRTTSSSTPGHPIFETTHEIGCDAESQTDPDQSRLCSGTRPCR